MEGLPLALASRSFGPPRGRIAEVPRSARQGRREWPGDDRAVALFLAGDVSAFEAIVRQHSPAVFGFVARFVGPAEAEEIVQDTFLRAWRSLETFRGESSLKTWLFTIALNRVRGKRGTLARLRAVFFPLVGRSGADEPEMYLTDPVDPSPNPEEGALTAERLERLRAAMGDLPEEFRTAVVLRDLEGLGYAEIAEALKVPIGTVRSRIARGRALLKESLS